MPDEDVSPLGFADRREQPFLYSWNRRVRHLHGISLRNLNIAPSVQRHRGKTITDDEYNLKSPAKLLAVSQQSLIPTSRSFSDLSKTDRPPTRTELRKASIQPDKHGAPVKRPKMGQLRRRSTMHWTGASPRVRQQKLEDVAMNRLVDTWFSIHHKDAEEPVYISEVMYKSMNPSFSSFDLDVSIAPVARSENFELRVWAKNEIMDGYQLLVDMSVDLRSLQFIGKSLENFHLPPPENCVLFHLTDGIYTSFADMPAEDIHEPRLRSNQKSIPPIATASYDALMKLANLDDCIQDALQTREKLEADINSLLMQDKDDARDTNVAAQHEKVKATKAALDSERASVQRLTDLRLKLERSGNERKQAMEAAVQAEQNAWSTPEVYGKAIQSIRGEIHKVEELSRGQIRRVCEGLHNIFPIEPVKNRTLQFTIGGIHLPNSVFDDTNRDEIAAALGYTAQLIHQLSMYLSIPLPYEIEPNASSSFIVDNISISLAQRRYPLHPTNVNYKFEYGVFLLNKDIEFLMSRAGLRVLDIRHTLPNLKYLLYILTAGTGELPARKVGGVRGLLAGVASPSLSRRNSDDSVHSRQDSTDYTNGSMVTAMAKEREKSTDARDLSVGPGRVKGLPYRKSLLREAG